MTQPTIDLAAIKAREEKDRDCLCALPHCRVCSAAEDYKLNMLRWDGPAMREWIEEAVKVLERDRVFAAYRAEKGTTSIERKSWRERVQWIDDLLGRLKR